MKLDVIKGIDSFKLDDRGVVVTIGTFDGVHRGHQAILHRLVEAAAEQSLEPLAITFEPHPRVLVTPDEPPPLLTVWDEKEMYFRRYMHGRVLVMEFNSDVMNLTAEQFVSEFLIKRINLKKLIVGYDHAFGKNRSGTINDLIDLSHRFSFTLEVVNPVILNGRPISSTRIRRLITDHKLGHAIEMLGHPYPIAGRVVRGIGLGRKIGYPTANIDFHARKMLPADGVYGCSVEVGGRLADGMMFIGHNHFNPEAGRSVEVNIFDFDTELYDQTLFCYPESFIRDNQLFDTTDELVAQIHEDKKNVLQIKSKGES